LSTKIIRQLFETRLATWAAARVPALRVNFEDVEFTPNPGETYLRCFVLPARTGSDDLQGIHRLYTGVWQVSIIKPSNSGLGTAYGIVDELETQFPQNLQLTSGSFMVAIRSPMGPGPAIQDSNTTTIPVSCVYRADVAL